VRPRLFGPESSGINAHLQTAGGTAAWIDAEHSFDPGYAAPRGVILERLPLAQPDSAEEALEMAARRPLLVR
jgi:recombination protein RecA